MQERDNKISNIFKEKKRLEKRFECKEITKYILFEEDSNFISLLNKKRKNILPIKDENNIKIINKKAIILNYLREQKIF